MAFEEDVTTTGGKICMSNKGICCCFSLFLFALCRVGRELQPGAEREAGKRREGSGRRICLEQNTVDSIMFYGRNASRTNWLQAPCLLSVHSTLLFPWSRMLRGHGESSLLLICGASWAVSRVK